MTSCHDLVQNEMGWNLVSEDPQIFYSYKIWNLGGGLKPTRVSDPLAAYLLRPFCLLLLSRNTSLQGFGAFCHWDFFSLFLWTSSSVAYSFVVCIFFFCF